MALALDCVCEDSGALTCQITSLVWVITDAVSDLPSGILTLTGGPYDVSIGGVGPLPWEAQEVDLGDPDPWLAAWDDLAYVFSAENSVSSDVLFTGFARFYLRSTFTCSDAGSPPSDISDQEQRAYNKETATDVCTPDEVEIHAVGTIGIGGVSGFIRHSRPLNDCNGFSVTGGDLQPKPKNVQTVDIFNSPPESLVLCPTGGSAPYMFGIKSGNLPGGMALDGSTGELTGTPDGSRAGSAEIIFWVLDGNHDYAEVTCSLLLGCSTTQESGNLFY